MKKSLEFSKYPCTIMVKTHPKVQNEKKTSKIQVVKNSSKKSWNFQIVLVPSPPILLEQIFIKSDMVR